MCRRGEFQVLKFDSNTKKIQLMVEVTNILSTGKPAEDAHQATLNITIPEALKYYGVRSTIHSPEGSRPHKVECQLNNTVICEVANPLRGSEKVAAMVYLASVFIFWPFKLAFTL